MMNYSSSLMSRRSLRHLGAACIGVVIVTMQIPVLAQAEPSLFPTPLPSLAVGSGSNTSATDYVLGGGDRLRIEVFNVPEYSREYQVLSNGTLSLPLIGVVPLQGLTLPQAMEEVTERYARYIRNPVITIELVAARSLRIAIAGEVNRPGVYTLVPNAGSDSAPNAESGSGVVTVTQALQEAGGVTQSANIRQIEIYRSQATQATGISLNANLWNLITTGDLSQDIVLQDGDTIMIPSAAATIDPVEAYTLAVASFSPSSMVVNVVGEVNAPGAIQVPPNTPLNQALLAAGGFNDDAEADVVQLVRLNPNGSVTQRTIAVNFSQGLNGETNPALRPNDTVVVGKSGRAAFRDTFGDFSIFTGLVLRLFGF